MTPCPTCGKPRKITRGSELRALRIRAGLTLSELARSLDLSKGYVSDVELGRRSVTPGLLRAYRGLGKTRAPTGGPR